MSLFLGDFVGDGERDGVAGARIWYALGGDVGQERAAVRRSTRPPKGV